MSEKQSTRRNFLQLLGLSVSATLISKSAVAGFIGEAEISTLNPEQQKFMIRYGKWMDEFIKVIHIRKTDPVSQMNNTKMIALTEKAEELKPELNEFMKDKTFQQIYKASIERMSKEV